MVDVADGGARSARRVEARGRGAVLRAVLDRVREDHLAVVAAGVAFDVFLSVFPTLIAAVSIYGLLSDPSAVEGQVAALGGLLPASALQLLRGQLADLTAAPRAALGWGTAISLLLALWTASRGAGALIEGVNVAYDLEERRGFAKVKLLSLGLSLAFVLFLLLSLALIAAVPNLLTRFSLPEGAVLAGRVIQWTLLAALAAAVLSAVYREAPSRQPHLRGRHGPGAAVAALLWLAGSALFAWYAENFGSYMRTYGALAGVAVLLLWLQLSFFAVLLGAEVNAALDRRARRTPA